MKITSFAQRVWRKLPAGFPAGKNILVSRRACGQLLAVVFPAALAIFSCTSSSLAAPSTSAVAPPAKPPATAPEEWFIVQDAYELGRYEIYIIPTAVKIVSPKYGYQIVVAAPDFLVRCFRPAEKIMAQEKISLFSGDMLNNPYGEGVADTRVLKSVRPKTLAGVPCHIYSQPTDARLVVVGADPIKIRPELAVFLARLYDIPNCGRVPFYKREDHGERGDGIGKDKLWIDVDLDVRSGQQVDVNTVSAKKIPYNPQDFVVPPDLKRTAQFSTVCFAGKRQENLVDALDGLGFTSDNAKNKKPDKPSPGKNTQNNGR